MALPAIVCLRSVKNDKYLRYLNEGVQTHGFVQFSGEKVMDPYVQFEVVKAKDGDGLVHLKSRYTNKYLVRWSPNHDWISASADGTNEDQSSWACTLFKPMFILDGETKKVRLLHVQLGHYACLKRADAPFDSCLQAGSKDPDSDSCDVFTIIDWKALLSLPKHVAFKGDNGKYLGAFTGDGSPYLQFAYADPNDPKAAHEVFSSVDGTVFIKSKHYGKFWRLGDGDWIVADVDDPRGTNNASAMFRLSVVDINAVALLNMSKTWYCKRFTTAGVQQSLLNAVTKSADQWAVLEVKDLGK